MSDQLKLLVVIVNYKATNLTIDCLHSISEQIDSLDRVQVAVCENGTGSEDCDLIQQTISSNGWESWCWLKAIYPNKGFSGGNNAVLEDVMAWEHPPEYFLLLNADTIVRPDAIKELLSAADQSLNAGIISPRLEWPDGTPQISCFRYINPLSEFIDAAHTGFITRMLRQYDVPIPVSDAPTNPEWTTFACALIKYDVFKKIGLLDPGFFLYFDDPDFCRRANRAGWEILNWPAARVVHLRGQSNPVKACTKELKRRPSYFYMSRARYFAKFYTPFGLWMTNILWLLGRCLSWCREMIGHKDPHVCKAEIRDIWKNSLHPMSTKNLGGDG